MEGKRTVKVDLEMLCMAMEDASWEHSYYLDLETGEILPISDYLDKAIKEELENRIDKEPERYQPVPRGDSSEGYEDMENFIATVENEHIAELLGVAIQGRGAFRRLKDTLARHPEEQERWFHFKDNRMKEKAREWLESIGVRLAGD